MGTALFPRKGCRAPTRLITLSDPAGIVPIRPPPIDIDNRARATMRSIAAAASKEISASSSRPRSIVKLGAKCALLLFELPQLFLAMRCRDQLLSVVPQKV
ncbi:MAG: hypothetical protein Ct9H300mP19_12430 [Dehalococcoidia bacterium]|nr:MAG: hypothetical protein Ct9H300mP19_12430 [Dehalococcoidia bacterium]